MQIKSEQTVRVLMTYKILW